MQRSLFILMILAILTSCSGTKDRAGEMADTPPLHSRSYDVHLFYYTWYGIPPVEGSYLKWTGTEAEDARGSVRHAGGPDIASSFFPAYGAYSSSDADIIKSHVGQIAAARIGVICISWWNADSLAAAPVGTILDEAAKSNIKVCFRLEVEEGSAEADVMEQARYIIDTYGKHEAFYITDRMGNRPVFYIGPCSLSDTAGWARYLASDGTESVRGTGYDALFIAVWKDRQDGELIEQAGFDGFYTWYAGKGESWGSDDDNYEEMNLFAMDSGLLFIPTVSPGFDDTRIHPWNREAVEIRGGGSHYMDEVRIALKYQPPFISINSFNNWIDGTQIEPATALQMKDFSYKHYGAQNEYLYLKLSAQWIQGFSR